MNQIVQLLRTGREDDREIARAILLHKYRNKIKEEAIKVFQNYYIIGHFQLQKILGEPIYGDQMLTLSIQFDFREEELFKD